MDEIRILEVASHRDKLRFVDLAYRIYRDDPGWVPMMRSDILAYLSPKTNGFLANGPFRILLAERRGKAIARIMVGIDEKSNRIRGVKNGWFSLFECLPEERPGAEQIIEAAVRCLISLGADKMSGPISPTGGDEFKGFLYDGRDYPAAYLCSWNPPWYPMLFQQMGFDSIHRLFGYRIHKDDLPIDRYERVVGYAQNRFGFRVDPIRLDDLEAELEDIRLILDESILDSWEDLTPPSIDELRKQADALRKFVDPDLILIARRLSDGKPIGFDLVLPDFSSVLRRIGGRMTPLGALRYLYYRRRIEGVRGFAQFVVPEYKRKGVMSAIFLEMITRGTKKGYCWADASTVGEENTASIANIESIGAKRYKEYWVMSRAI